MRVVLYLSKEKEFRLLDSFGMEKWRYYDGVLQHWYTFNAKGELDYSNYRK